MLSYRKQIKNYTLQRQQYLKWSTKVLSKYLEYFSNNRLLKNENLKFVFPRENLSLQFYLNNFFLAHSSNIKLTSNELNNILKYLLLFKFHQNISITFLNYTEMCWRRCTLARIIFRMMNCQEFSENRIIFQRPLMFKAGTTNILISKNSY